MSMPSFTQVYHRESYPSIPPTRPELSAEGKVVLVTGAGSGVGAATAKAFAQAKAKAIILTGRRLNALEETKSSIESEKTTCKIGLFSLDIASEENVKKVFDDSEQDFGPIDICINGGAHLSDKGTIRETSLSNFWTSFEVNVKGSFLIAQAFLNEKHSSKDRVLVLLSSFLAHLPASELKTAPASYGLTKLAVAKMAEYIGAENASDPTLRVYSVQPGIIPTDMSDKSVEMAPPGTREKVKWESVDLPAHFFVWLCSPEGQVIPNGKFLWTAWDVDELKQRKGELEADPDLLTMTMKGWPFEHLG